jgi:protocatechuate 3,4-dioxygenase beta subunit
MNGSNHYRKIEDSIKRLRRKTDEQLDKRILEDTLATFAEEIPRRTGWQLFFSNKITRIAAAAVILVVIVIAAQKYVAVKKGPAEGESIIPAAKENKTAAIEEAGVLASQEAAAVKSAETMARQDFAKLEEELKQIIPLVSANDANGLAKMLANAGAESRLAAIVYLANMGNQRSVDILDKLSAGLGTNEPNNIFAVTSAVLKKRLEGKTVDSNKPELAEKKTKKYEFVPRGVLSGLVTDANTALPVAGAAVKLLNDAAYTANSDANGFYFFDEAEHPGDYNIAVLSKEYIGQTSAIQIAQENLSDTASGRLVADFRLQKACSLELTVADEANEPVPGAEVFITSDAESNKIIDTGFEQATDEKGVLLLGGLKKGIYNIIIIDRVPDMNDISRLVPDFAPQHTQVELENPLVPERRKITLTKGFEVNGLVQFAGGLPATDLKISAMPAWWLLPFTIQNYTTDFEGKFTLEHITAGTYRIKVKKPSDANILTINTELPPHEQPLIITLPQDSNAPDPNVVSAQNPL